MNPQDSIDEARFTGQLDRLLHGKLPPQAPAAWLAAGYDAQPRECLREPVPCAHARFLEQCSRALVAWLEAQTPAVVEQSMGRLMPVVQRLQSLRRRLPYEHRWRIGRRPYRPERCGDYPLRDAGHDALRVLDAAPHSDPARSGRRYGWAAVAPFVDARLPRRARARLYEALTPRQLKACDLLCRSEAALVGQWGVFAARTIPAGSCLGVYGGQLLRGDDWMLLPDDRYLIALDQQGRVRMDGETLLSLANTLYLPGAADPPRHAEDGYNCEMARFPARLAHGWDASVPALFATQDIAAGEELRWHYGIERIRSHNAPQAG
jgi:hypothetical protein